MSNFSFSVSSCCALNYCYLYCYLPLASNSEEADTWARAFNWLRSVNSQVSQPFNFQHNVTVNADFTWELPPNQSIESLFELSTVLGQGTFGKVFKARHRDTGFALAIKLVDVQGLSDVSEIKREVDVLKECRFKNIVDYFGCWGPDQQHQLWTLMSYCQFGSAIDLLYAAQVYLSEVQIAFIIASTLAGLHYLHTIKRIVHRDVKARNILVTGNGCIKLADFGISKQVSTENIGFCTIGTGSPHWMSPEVVQDEPATFASDIWSLGITAIELTTCLPPRADLGVDDVMAATVRDAPPTLAPAPAGRPAWSREFVDFVTVCLQKDPAMRPTTADLLKHPFVRIGIMENHCLDPILQKVEAQQRQKNDGSGGASSSNNAAGANNGGASPRGGLNGGAGAGASGSANYDVDLAPINNLNAATVPGKRVLYSDSKKSSALASPNSPSNGPVTASFAASPSLNGPSAARSASGAYAGAGTNGIDFDIDLGGSAYSNNSGGSGGSGGNNSSNGDGVKTVTRVSFEDNMIAFASGMTFRIPDTLSRALSTAGRGTPAAGAIAERFAELCLPPFVEVVVGTPETRSSTLGNYSAYPVRVRANPVFEARPCTLPLDIEEVGTPTLAKLIADKDTVVVYRRYSDFLWFHEQLEFAFPGLLIPPMPGKHFSGNFDDEIINDRRQGLQWYLDSVARHPLLSKSFLFHAFVRLSAEKFPGLKKYVSQRIDDLRKAAKQQAAARAGSDLPGAAPVNALTGRPMYSFPAHASALTAETTFADAVNPVKESVGFFSKLKSKVISSKTTSLLLSLPAQTQLTVAALYAKDIVWYLSHLEQQYGRLDAGLTTALDACAKLGMAVSKWVTSADQGRQALTIATEAARDAAPVSSSAAVISLSDTETAIVSSYEAARQQALAKQAAEEEEQRRRAESFAAKGAASRGSHTASATPSLRGPPPFPGTIVPGAGAASSAASAAAKLPKSAKKAATVAAAAARSATAGAAGVAGDAPWIEFETALGPGLTLLAQRVARDLGPVLAERCTKLNAFGLYPAKFYRKLCGSVRDMIRRYGVPTATLTGRDRI